jgi:hypothetical protein
MPEKSQKSIDVTVLSTLNEEHVQSALVNIGAVHTIIGKSTPFSMIKSPNIGRIEICQKLPSGPSFWHPMYPN